MAAIPDHTPVAIPAKDTGTVVRSAFDHRPVVAANEVHTITLTRLTPGGTDGSCTITNGRITSFTRPT